MEKNNTQAVCFNYDSICLEKYENKEYRHLRTRNGKIVPLFSVIKIQRAQENNHHPFNAASFRIRRKRIPRSTPHYIDTLLEYLRSSFYSNYPSRQHSVFANIGGYQPKLLNQEKNVFLLLPHKDSKVSVFSEPNLELKTTISDYSNFKNNLKEHFKILKKITTYWHYNVLIKDLIIEIESKGNEVLIQGPVLYIDFKI